MNQKPEDQLLESLLTEMAQTEESATSILERSRPLRRR